MTNFEALKKMDIQVLADFLRKSVESDYLEMDFCGCVCPFKNECDEFSCKILDDGLDMYLLWLEGEV